jgi:hypothetical protein
MAIFAPWIDAFTMRIAHLDEEEVENAVNAGLAHAADFRQVVIFADESVLRELGFCDLHVSPCCELWLRELELNQSARHM